MVQSASWPPQKNPAELGPSEGGGGSRRTRSAWITATFFAALVTVVGCGGESQEANDVAIELGASPQIFGGAPDAEQSGVVALRIGDHAPYEICSGALVAPNVVLTARHCVSRMIAKNVVCTDRGLSANGAHVAEDHPNWMIQVFVGERPNFHTEPAASAVSIVRPDGRSLCNADIALVVLDRAPAGASPLPVRLGGGVQANERIRAVGYGKSDMNDGPGTRMRRDDVGVLEVGAKLTASDTALGDREFEVGRSICQGDSGGPSISERTGAVLGVVSRGADCGQDFGHVYTQTSGFEALFARATEIARTTITREDGEIMGSDALVASSRSADIQSGCALGARSSDGGTRASGGALVLVGLAGVVGLARRRRR